jgi:hypothetical protein
LRTLSCRFDETGTKTEDNSSWLQDASEIKWIFPVKNTMIRLPDFNYEEFNWKVENTGTDTFGYIRNSANEVTHATITRVPPADGSDMILTQDYCISNYFSVAHNLNTIDCQVIKNTREYLTSKEMTFG